MRITNISSHKLDVQLVVKNEDGSDVEFLLKYGQTAFTPTNQKTRTVNMHGAKRHIGVSFEDEKPEHLEFFIGYYDSELESESNTESKPEVATENTPKAPVKAVNDPVANTESKSESNTESLQDLMDFESKIKDIDTEDKSEVLYQKSKEAIGADEEQLYSELNLDAIKESVKEYIEEDKPKPKPKSKSKRGPGRPKKRGPKPKKKPVGRPKGSKNKKK